jgi:hypothetical protein
MTIKGVVLLSYGMGGAAIETWSTGLRLLTSRCKADGLETFASPYNWSQVNELDAIISRVPVGIPIAVGGSSLGDDNAPVVASRTKRIIRYLFGFQDSMYGVSVKVPDNVQFADNIYNPSWIQTFGLGYRQWTRTTPRSDDQKTGRLRNIPIYAPHPDDWGVAQDVVFSRIHALIAAAPPPVAPIGASLGA